MAHVSKEALRRLATGEAGEVEIERLVEHALDCQSCRALISGHFAAIDARAKREGPLKTLLDIAEQESARALGILAAKAEWSSLGGLTRRAQKDRVIQSRACHSSAFLEVLLAELRSARSRDESEFLASLASLAVQRMDEKKYPTALKNDFLGGIWTEVANARRISTEWHYTGVALQKAEQYLADGTGDPLSKARLLSITASLHEDRGHPYEAVALLERCKQIYEASKEWSLVARTLVKMAYVLVDQEPERGLALLDQADPLIPVEDSALRWLAATLRTEGLIETRQLTEALIAFQKAEALRAFQTRPDVKLRSTFTAARLFEALGRIQEAETLFEEVISGDLNCENYHTAFLDFLYLFSFHIRTGSTEKAIQVCQRALAQLDLLELGHDQLRAVWTQLRDAAGRQALTSQSLAAVRSYLRVHWKHPAAQTPVIAARSNGS